MDMNEETPSDSALIAAGALLQWTCHQASASAGWWGQKLPGSSAPEHVEAARGRTPFGLAVACTKLALVHSEVSEALEGLRKNRNDEHLPHRKSVEVELADAVIRIFDLAGALNLDVGTALAEKLHYNRAREDHKLQHRAAEGGKAF